MANNLNIVSSAIMVGPGPTTANTVIRNSTMSMRNTGGVGLVLCKIMKVNSSRMTVDVHVPDISTMLYNVPICFPSKGVGYGSFFMPRSGSWYLLAFASNRRPYLLTSTYNILNDDGSDDGVTKEKILAGENVIQAIGGAYLRQDILGNQILRSSFGNSIILDKNGVNRQYSNGKEDITISSKSIHGFGIDLNENIDNSLLNNPDVKVINHDEYYSSVASPKVFKSSEIVSTVNGEIIINNTNKQTIVNSALTTIGKLRGTNGLKGFYDTLSDFRQSIQDGTLTNNEVEGKFTDIVNYLNTNFHLERKGVKIVIEKGNAVNKNIDSINDVLTLTAADFVKNTDGDDICFRISIVDITSNNTKFEFTVDVNGHAKLKATSYVFEQI